MTTEWKLVPVEPTPEMLAVADKHWNGWEWRTFTDFYKGMVSAAPQQIAPQPMSDQQVEDFWRESNRGFSIEREHYFKAFRDAEKAHGIK